MKIPGFWSRYDKLSGSVKQALNELLELISAEAAEHGFESELSDVDIASSVLDADLRPAVRYIFTLHFGPSLDALLRGNVAAITLSVNATDGTDTIAIHGWGSRLSVPVGREDPAAYVRALRRVELALCALRSRLDQLKPAPETTTPTTHRTTEKSYPPTVIDELKSALKSLGFPKSECNVRAEQAVAAAPAGSDLSELIRYALKKETSR